MKSNCGIPAEVASALLKVVDAVRDVLPPDGISEGEFTQRIIQAVDNSEINPFVMELENGCP